MSTIEIIGAILGSSAVSAAITGLTAFFLARRKQTLESKRESDKSIADLADERVEDIKSFFSGVLEERKLEINKLVEAREFQHNVADGHVNALIMRVDLLIKDSLQAKEKIAQLEAEVLELKDLVNQLLTSNAELKAISSSKDDGILKASSSITV